MTDLKLVKKLRETTGCGVSDCSKALAATDNNFDEAVDWLRKKGLSSAAKKSERAATEGLIGISIQGQKAAMVEINSETDFVARNDRFQNLVKDILSVALTLDSSTDLVENLKTQRVDGKLVTDVIADNIATIGENIQLRRAMVMELRGQGHIVSYTHTAAAENLGKIGVLVALKSNASGERLFELGKKIAMHVAAAKPEFLSRDVVPIEKLERERDILIEQARNSGKPDNIIEKMIEGRIKKFYEEICLLEQAFVMDEDMKVSDLLTSFRKETGEDVEIQDYCLYVLGQGLEKKESNFAEEVAAMAKK
ncbi:MAG: translation elongation factor Ts [Rickettsiales bacterium]|jgi:elongation factor Ts|nr:translation elongation factor Ts [Rickettsiales bacterium]